MRDGSFRLFRAILVILLGVATEVGAAASWPWRPFESVQRPPVPRVVDVARGVNPVDAFVSARRVERGLSPRPEASREVLLRRVYLDLVGLVPTPEERAAFLADDSPRAYERLVDRLLEDPRHGERWGRHWMDVWRYSDWAGWAGGNQIRDSQPHIWRWRDWIVESLNRDKGYDRMVVEMLAADEVAPEDPEALRATGFLVRNYKMLSREQWLEDTIKHTSQAFLGLTLGCAKCHDHLTDPVTQAEYYRLRAVFEPHGVRLDRVPGQLDTALDGLARVYDSATNGPTFFLLRGDERRPDTNRVMSPGVPAVLGGRFEVSAVSLPRPAARPDERPFVRRDAGTAADLEVTQAREALDRLSFAKAPAADEKGVAELRLAAAGARRESLALLFEIEDVERESGRGSPEADRVARQVVAAQRRQTLAEARLGAASAGITERVATEKLRGADEKNRAGAMKELEAAKLRSKNAAKTVAEAEANVAKPVETAYAPRASSSYPATSTGRRHALARWITDRENPLAARVAVNHVWLRHFGRGLVASPADFGRASRPPTHPELLDWLAVEFMEQGWSLKHLHRLLVTSATYRMASTPDSAGLAADPDNELLWRMNSRRMEAELVRDNQLHVAGSLDPAMGGADIDHQLGLTSRRRSLYLRLAAEKDVEFLRIFDGPSVTECYARRPTVVPQQALALANSELSLREARRLAARLSGAAARSPEEFVDAAFRRVLSRSPTAEESRQCREFLAAATARTDAARARENLALVLFNHNDFITIR